MSGAKKTLELTQCSRISGVVLEHCYIPWFSTVTDVPKCIMSFQLWMYKSILLWRTNRKKRPTDQNVTWRYLKYDYFCLLCFYGKRSVSESVVYVNGK
jgi:hypothetical protein